MFATLVASLCLLGSPVCVEEIVTDTAMDASFTWQGCMIQGEIGVSSWIGQSSALSHGLPA